MLNKQNLKGIFWASRPINLWITWITFSVAAYFSFIYSFQFIYSLNYWLQSIVIVIVTASGYIVNDLYDYKIDLINKPHKTYVNFYASSKKFWTAYFIMISMASLMSLFLPIKFLIINISSIIILFLYAYYFKRYAIVGNLIVSTLTSMVIICGGLLVHIKLPLMWMSIFAFQINLIREIIKDVEDIKGDLKNFLKTLPIIAGLKLTQIILFSLIIILILSIPLPFIFHYIFFQEYLWSYLFISSILVILPLFFVLRTLLNKGFFIEKYTQTSSYLKWIMIGGIVSCFFLK